MTARLDAADDPHDVIEPLGPCRCHHGKGALAGEVTCMRTGARRGDENGPRAIVSRCEPEDEDNRRKEFEMTNHIDTRSTDRDRDIEATTTLTLARTKRDAQAADAWKTTTPAKVTPLHADAIEVDPLDVDAARARREAILSNAWKVTR